MTFPISFRQRVGKDLAAARQWYESQGGDELGEKFLSAAAAVFGQIQVQPQAFQLVREEVRRAIVHRFPYFVFYLFEHDQIVVLAVLHTSRNPALWPRSGTDTR